NASSDLDLIVIYDADGVDASDGRRPLASRAYYARLTQAMVTAMTAQMAQGRLYEVDMRLRPSGTQGPVATSLTSFKDYQKNEAWTWEHLALTRARPVAGDHGVRTEIETFRKDLLKENRDDAKIRTDVQEMRERISAAKASSGPWDAKIGRGRLQDIELASQAATLMSGSSKRTVVEGIEAGVAIDWFDAAEGHALDATYALLWKVQVVSKLLNEQNLSESIIGVGGAAFLLRETGMETLDELEQSLTSHAERAAQIIEAALLRAPQKGI
ncbi:MAG: glutamine-synthetase adenylyltransferase, partial [Pseudoruegeria sp.]